MVGYSKIDTEGKFRNLFQHVDYSEIMNTTHNQIWKAPNSIPERNIGPSSLFIELLGRIEFGIEILKLLLEPTLIKFLLMF